MEVLNGIIGGEGGLSAGCGFHVAWSRRERGPTFNRGGSVCNDD